MKRVRMRRLDELDMRILTELVKDAGISIPKLSKKIQTNSSVVYSRVKRLIKRNVIKRFTVEVNDEFFGYKIAALVGLNIDSRMREGILKSILELEGVTAIREVTGRFDLMVSIKAKNLDELHTLVNGMRDINGVHHTETFVKLSQMRREPTYRLLT